ncbi:MAG: DUF507 family protein [bacterium]|nr:DUF507 family protein [bacterium]
MKHLNVSKLMDTFKSHGLDTTDFHLFSLFFRIPPRKLIYFAKFVILHSMRLNKLQIEHMAFTVVKGLLKDNALITEDKESLVKEVESIIANELAKEDQLDEQVKEILKEKLDEIRNTNVDYYEMFKMVKSKLAEKENIVI